MKILANDGIDEAGKKILEEAGHTVDTNKIPQQELAARLPAYDGLIVRSATKVRSELLDACPNLRLVARAGVGMDNIDVENARSRGIVVLNSKRVISTMSLSSECVQRRVRALLPCLVVERA